MHLLVYLLAADRCFPTRVNVVDIGMRVVEDKVAHLERSDVESLCLGCFQSLAIWSALGAHVFADREHRGISTCLLQV